MKTCLKCSRIRSKCPRKLKS